MFITDKLIYIRLQKTGSNYMASILAQLFSGKHVGKHRAATPEQIQKNYSFLSSIRNPWHWYLSLWSFGVQGDGRLMRDLTQHNVERLVHLQSLNPNSDISSEIQKAKKNTMQWQGVYSDVADVGQFRRWLQLIHQPENSAYLGEEYGSSSIAQNCGFMTYRYLYLCCQNSHVLHQHGRIKTQKDIAVHDKANCYINSFIRQESLKEDLIKSLTSVDALTKTQLDIITNSQKTNATSRPLAMTDYYDTASIDLVAKRDGYLIEKFGYQFR